MPQQAAHQPMSKAYTPAEHEARIWDKWISADAFHADPDRVLSGEARPYCVLIPPPNVTAALHLGHALNNSIQDILVRAHRMKGYETLWMPGTDHAGIATQTMVDKKLREEGRTGIGEYKKKELAGENGREQFIAKVQDFKDEFEARITDQLMKMGCSCDWARQRFTMDDICARAVREAFFQLFKDGLIYRGKRLVNWDPVTQTALADDEVEMEETDGFFWYMKYPVIDDAGKETGEFVTVATTRPETFFGDTAVAVNPNDAQRAVSIGKRVRLPFVNRVIPVIGDDYVVPPDPESSDSKAKFATGFLKVTPAHDPNDYMIGQRHDLPIINVMAPDASISDQHGWEDVGDASRFLGLSREDARTAVEHAFRDANLLAGKKPYSHSVGHSYRSHAPIEPYLSDQWYCKVTDDRLRGNAQRALVPEQRTGASLQAWPESAPLPGGPARRAGSSLVPLNQISIPDSSPLRSNLPLHAAIPMSFKPCNPFPKGERSSDDLRQSKRDLPHLQLPDATYFVTWRTANSGKLEQAERAALIECLHHRQSESATIDAVVVMPDHAHMLLRLSPGADLNKWMAALKRFSARTINESRQSSGSVWQDEHFDRIVRDENEYVDHLTYIFDNPKNAGLCDTRFDWDGTCASTHMIELLEIDLPEQEPGSASRATGDKTTDGTMHFYPSRYAKTYETWHDNLRDWCISRQLWWGHRIPVWSASTYVDETGSWQESWGRFVFAESRCRNSDTACFRAYTLDDGSELGLDIGGDETITNINRPAAAFVCLLNDDQDFITELESRGFTQDPDVLDTWFSSALWPLSTMGWPDASAARNSSGIEDFESLLPAFNPTSVLTTAREIITLWVSRMTMFNRYFLSTGGPARRAGSSESQQHDQEPGSASRATEDMPGPAPFKDVFIHAMIQDGEGRKMSKSLGNGVDPLDIIDSHGADAMRFTLCQMTTQTQDVRMPVERDETTGKNTSPKFDLGRNLCNKLWNAAKFSLAMFEKAELKPGLPIDPEELTLIDRWMLSRVAHATSKVDNTLRTYMFKDYADAIYDLFWRDFCGWYLESIKPTIADNPQQAAVLRSVFDAILRLMHPIMPFITETLFERFESLPLREIAGFGFEVTKSNATLCQSGWPVLGSDLRDEVAEEAYERVRSLVTTIREVRAQAKVPPKRQIVLHATGELAADIGRWSPLIETLAGVGAVSADKPDGQSAAFTFEGTEYRLSNLADALDASAERVRLEKELASIEKSVSGIKGRLSNPGYTDKAPAHLVQQTRDQLAQLEQDRDATRAALDKLG